MVISFFAGLVIGSIGTVVGLHTLKSYTRRKVDHEKKINKNDINFLNAKLKKVI